MIPGDPKLAEVSAEVWPSWGHRPLWSCNNGLCQFWRQVICGRSEAKLRAGEEDPEAEVPWKTKETLWIENCETITEFFSAESIFTFKIFLPRLYPPDPNSEGLNPRLEPFPKFYQLNQDSNVMACLYHVWSALVVTTLPGFAWTPSTPWSMLWDVMKVWSRQNAPLPRSLKKGYDQIEWPSLWCLEEISPAILKEGGIPIVSCCTERFLNSKLFKTGQWIYTVIWVYIASSCPCSIIAYQCRAVSSHQGAVYAPSSVSNESKSRNRCLNI